MEDTSTQTNDTFAILRSILESRIMVLDGAMGTEIQTYKLQPTDFHGTVSNIFLDFFSLIFVGTEFVNHPKDLTGNNDILSLTRPDLIKKIHSVRFLFFKGF